MRRRLLCLEGVSGIMFTLRGENGSSASISGLVTLPPKEVGRVLNVSQDESDESDRIEDTDEDLSMSHAWAFDSDTTAGFVCAGGVAGGLSWYGGSSKRSTGKGSVMLCWKVGRIVVGEDCTSIEGRGESTE